MPRSNTRFIPSRTYGDDDFSTDHADDIDSPTDQLPDDTDPTEPDDDTAPAPDDEQYEKFRFTNRLEVAPRAVVIEGKSGRHVVDDAETYEGGPDDDAAEPATYSTYDTATHGPDPAPDWVVTSFSAVDTPLGILKTGKEADVHLLDRSLPGGASSLLAVKTYRSAEHRMFHRDSTYQEGRRTKRSRESRAMAARTSFGRELLAGKWAAAEFDALGRLWAAGAPVPYPVQLIGSELMMEFIGDADGLAAPRLAAVTAPADIPAVDFFGELWRDLVASLELLASMGFAHGDLSPYNVLVDGTRCVLIDLPQIVDVIANPQGGHFLARDAANVASFFHRRGVEEADGDLLTARLADHAGL